MSTKQKVGEKSESKVTQYMEISDSYKSFLKKCNLKKDEVDIMVKTAKRVKDGKALTDKLTKKTLLWKTLAKLIVSGEIMEVKEASGENGISEAKTKNEKFDEDLKEILEVNPSEEVSTPEEKALKDVCLLFDKGPNLCKYGMVGNGCEWAHPTTCGEFDRKGEIGCTSPCDQGLHHRPVCKYLTKKEVCPKGQKCGPTKIYHPPELEKIVQKDAEKKEEEKKKKAKEAEEKKAFLGETKKLREENQVLKKEIEDLKLLLGNNSRFSVPPPSVPPPQSWQSQQQPMPMQFQQLQEQVLQLQQQLLSLQQNQVRAPMQQQPMQQMGLRNPMMQQGTLQWFPNQNMN